MPSGSKTEKARYMRDYRKKIRTLAGLSDEKLEAKIEEYKSQGLGRNDLFMDMVYQQAMRGNNAKYAELWWRMQKPEEKEEHKYTVADNIRLAREVVDMLKENWKTGGIVGVINGKYCTIINKPCPWHPESLLFPDHIIELQKNIEDSEARCKPHDRYAPKVNENDQSENDNHNE